VCFTQLAVLALVLAGFIVQVECLLVRDRNGKQRDSSSFNTGGCHHEALLLDEVLQAVDREVVFSKRATDTISKLHYTSPHLLLLFKNISFKLLKHRRPPFFHPDELFARAPVRTSCTAASPVTHGSTLPF